MTWSINYWRNKETQYPGSTKSSKTKQLQCMSKTLHCSISTVEQLYPPLPQGTGPSDITVPRVSPDPALIRHCLPIAHTKHPLTPLTSNNDLTHPRIALYSNQDVQRKWGRGLEHHKKTVTHFLLCMRIETVIRCLPDKNPFSGGLRWRCDSAKINMSCGFLGVFFYRKNVNVCKL